MNSTDDANDMDGMGGMVNAGATDGVECWETARANHDFSSRHGHALAGMLGPAFVAAVAYVDPGNVRRISHPARGTDICWCGCWYSPIV